MSSYAIGAAGYIANCAQHGSPRGEQLRRRLDRMQWHMISIYGRVPEPSMGTYAGIERAKVDFWKRAA